jgi:hypothetical protein
VILKASEGCSLQTYIILKEQVKMGLEMDSAGTSSSQVLVRLLILYKIRQKNSVLLDTFIDIYNIGVYIYPGNTERYEGMYKHDKRHGWGIYFT